MTNITEDKIEILKKSKWKTALGWTNYELLCNKFGYRNANKLEKFYYSSNNELFYFMENIDKIALEIGIT